MPGPAPDPNARRRNARPDWVFLPPGGFDGGAPGWPLSSPEPAIWEDLWVTPQAKVWADSGWTRVIARYAFLVDKSESEDVNAALLSEIRQLEDRIGLSPMAMKRLQWEIQALVAVVDEHDDDNVTYADFG